MNYRPCGIDLAPSLLKITALDWKLYQQTYNEPAVVLGILMRKKKPDKELAQLKNALRFLADELERTASDELKEGKRARAASQAGLHLGISKARYQAAGAVHLVVNMVETLDSENEIGPLSVVREIIEATDQ